jgi:hypothetical protein
MSHSPPPSVTGGVNNQAVGEGASVTYNAKAEEGKATAEATGGSEEPQLEDVTEIAALRRLIRQSEERARQREERAAEQMEQMAYMIQQQAAATERLMQGHNRTAPAAARSAADTLRSPVSVHVKRSILTERTSSAPLPFGPLQTPAAATRGTANVVEDEEDGVNARVIGVAGMTLNNILGHVGRYVKPFHADSNKDKDRTVLQFVQSIESTMGDLLIDPKSRWRLMVVKMCLQDGALDWMEQKMHDISDTAKRLGIDPQPLLVWDGEIRRAFIRQHLGTDTAELWLSKLEMLVLGSEKTPSPIELDSQFDAIARHVYATRPAEDEQGEMLLSSKYKSIISKSRPRMYENIVRFARPHTLKGWKEALAAQWLGEEEIKAERQRNAAATYGSGGWHSGRGGGRGRGGQHASNREGREAQTQAVNAVSSVGGEDANMEGEPMTTEGENDEKRLNAASSSRGGRGGGRGGRGRGAGVGAPSAWSTDRQKLYDEDKCFNCKEAGHRVKDCTKPKQQQGNA